MEVSKDWNLQAGLTSIFYRLFYHICWVDGVRIVAFADEDELSIKKAQKALRLVERHDQLRFKRLNKDLTGGISISPTAMNPGEFHSKTYTSILQSEYVSSEVSVEEISSTIVHEATHAKLWRAGIRYEEPIRYRVEVACLRQEIEFLKKLPDSDDLVASLRQHLEDFSPDQVDETAFHQMYIRHRRRMFKKLRMMGVPNFFVKFFGSIGSLATRVKRLLAGR